MVSWDAEAVSLVSAEDGDFGTVTLDEEETGSGRLTIGTSASEGTTNSFTLARLTLRAGTMDGPGTVSPAVTAAGNAEVDVVDAQQIARDAAGLETEGRVGEPLPGGCEGENQAPTAEITSPEDGVTVNREEAVTLEGSGTDPEDGSVPGDALRWATDVDGGLAAGASLTTTLTPDATHRVTLAVTDSDGAADVARVTVNVTAEKASFRLARVSAGRAYTCGVKSDGTAFCWGSNRHGKLGLGTDTGQLGDGPGDEDSSTPVAVAGGVTLEQLDAGRNFTCGAAAYGTAWCWGHGFDGQLGHGGSPFGVTTPVEVEGDITFEQVSAGAAHSCGVAADGTTYCWGATTPASSGSGLSPAPLKTAPTRRRK